MKSLILIGQMNLKSVLFVCIRVFEAKGFRFRAVMWNGCYDVLKMFINIKSIVTLNIHGVHYCCIIAGMTVIVWKEFDSKSIYHKKLLKTKLKSCDDEATDFHD